MSPALQASEWRDLAALHRELEAIARELRRGGLAGLRLPHCWQPAVNVYRCETEYHVCVELAGIDAASLRVLAEPRRLTIRGRRPSPEPEGATASQVLALEIDHGPFERVVVFPTEIDVTRVEAKQSNGLVWIRLPFAMAA